MWWSLLWWTFKYKLQWLNSWPLYHWQQATTAPLMLVLRCYLPSLPYICHCTADPLCMRTWVSSLALPLYWFWMSNTLPCSFRRISIFIYILPHFHQILVLHYYLHFMLVGVVKIIVYSQPYGPHCFIIQIIASFLKLAGFDWQHWGICAYSLYSNCRSGLPEL
jgi:hypothetical protein